MEAPVLAVRELEAGSAIGYGGRRLERAKRAATLGLGYADGLPERFTQTCQAYVADRALDFLGSDSMTLSTLDISTLPPGRLRRGQAVEIVGPYQDVNAVGHALGINPNRVLSSFGARAARRYHPAAPQGDGGAEWISG
ncbi:alanine racemase C-terminal domain-containing protein [Fodinicurvata halophila]|uniref:alanine racemase C-terminal domain-containing protein n=1 Tax=Fodinicurvata halophila TaxID=1419723 RepID=UPI00362CCB59